MKHEFTPGGWEILHGRNWPLHEVIEPGIITAYEARRHLHFDGTELMRRDGWTLAYHFDSKLRFRTEFCRWAPYVTGTWLLYPPHVTYQQDTRKSGLPLRATWIHFHGGERLGLSNLVENPRHMACIEDPSGWLLEKIRGIALFGESHGDEDYPHALMGFMEILHRLILSPELRPGLRRLAPDQHGTQPNAALVARVRDYIALHLAERITLPLLAREFRMSVSSLKRHYGAATRDSIKRAVTTLRISRAKHLLSEGRTLAEIAALTGFSSQFHLSRAFRRSEGIPPRDFLRRLQRSVPGP